MKLSIASMAAAMLAVANASPLAMPVEISARQNPALSQDLLNKFKYYAEYAAAAYCNNNGDSTGTPITCFTNNCQAVVAANAISVLEFDDQLISGIQGFVSTSAVKKEIVLTFRGSNTIRNWVGNLNIALLSPGFTCSGCKVHAGFLTAWREPRTKIINAIKAARAANPTYKVIISGHSLGGAVGTIAAADLRSQGIPLDLYTYGSPRVGNKEFATFVSSQRGITARITKTQDPVPRLPPLVLTPFRHTTPEYWLSNGAPTKTNYVLSDIKVCTGTASLGCNAGTVPSLDFDTHRFYFVDISACAPDLGFRKRQESEGASDKEILKWLSLDVEYGDIVEARE